MAKISVVKGATSVLVRVFLQDSSSTTGAGLTGLTSGSSGLVCYRARDDDGNAAATQITLSAGTRGTWSSGGFVEKDSTNQPGIYEFGIPNNALATGSRTVDIMFKGATNLAPAPLEIELTGVDNQDGVHFGLTGIPNAAAGASGGLLISGSNAGTTTLAALTVTGSFTVSDGFIINRSTSNASAIVATGNGTGHGIDAESGSGATGDGFHCVSNATNGNGISGTGKGTGNGVNGQGGNGASGDGAHFAGGTGNSAGLRCVVGSAGTSDIVGQVALNSLDLIVTETGLNIRQATSLNTAALCGVLSGAATTTVTILGAGVGTTRISATVDANGNRSAVTLTPPA